MTAPTIATEDFMFDLDLRIVPVEEGKAALPRAGAQGVDIQGRDRDHITRTLIVTYCRSYITCTRCQ